MARYIDADALIESIQETLCSKCDKYDGIKCKSCGIDDTLDFLDTAPTADVAPKSEVAALGREVERLTNILNSYALQYGTVKDQHEVIDKAKAEAVKEFAEYLKKYYRHIDKTAGALIEYTIDKKVKAFLGKEGVDDD